MKYEINLLASSIAVTAAVGLSLLAPPPLCFWCALLAIFTGPGLGIPFAIVPRGILTIPEAVLIIVLGSAFINDAMFTLLNALGLRLTVEIVSLVILGETYASSALAIVSQPSNRRWLAGQVHEPPWLWFLAGVVLAVLPVLILGYVQGRL